MYTAITIFVGILIILGIDSIKFTLENTDTGKETVVQYKYTKIALPFVMAIVFGQIGWIASEWVGMTIGAALGAVAGILIHRWREDFLEKYKHLQ